MQHSLELQHHTTAYLRMRVACAKRNLLAETAWRVREQGHLLVFADAASVTRWLLEFGG